MPETPAPTNEVADYRLLLKKLFIREYELLGTSDVMEAVVDSEGTQFSPSEQDLIRDLRDEAHAEWLCNFHSESPDV
jgi:hypothetical protein